MKLGQVRAAHMPSLVAGAALASACTVSTPATITSTQSASQAISSVELLSEADEAGLRAQFLDKLTQSLRARSVAVQTGADYAADFSVSQRSAQLGLQAISKGEQADATAAPPEPDFKNRWYHKCKPHRVSASLVIYARASGKVHAKSSGEFLTCPGDLSQLDDLAQILVDRTLTN